MAVTTFTHGRKVVVFADPTNNPPTDNITAWCNESNLPYNRAEHETTVYGVDDATFQGGLRDRTFELKGRWNPAFEVKALALKNADEMFLEWRPAGTGTGLPFKRGSGFVTKYDSPANVTDMIGWSMTVRVSGAITEGVQP
jgi:hypothetical protein